MPKLTQKALSAAFVRTARPKTSPTTGQPFITEFPDTEANEQPGVRGLVLRVTHSGSKSWAFKYRLSGRRRKMTLGAYPAISLQEARRQASQFAEAVSKGGDPLLDKQEARREASEQPQTVGELCDTYLERWADERKSKKAAAEDKRLIKKHIKPRLKNVPIAKVNAYDIESLVLAMKSTPYQANRTLALLSKMFSMAIRWQLRTSNPAKGIERYAEEGRERTLTPPEIAALSTALDDLKDQNAANAIRLLLLTGARVGETLSAKWEQFDLETGFWTKPSAHTKQKKTHRIPLSPAALEIVKNIDQTGEYLFPGRTPGTHRTTLKRLWEDIRKEVGIQDVRLHDLRHTYASILVSAGQSLPIIGRLLGHTQTQTTARYAHLFDDPLKEATKRVAEVIANAGKDEKKVVNIRD